MKPRVGSFVKDKAVTQRIPHTVWGTQLPATSGLPLGTAYQPAHQFAEAQADAAVTPALASDQVPFTSTIFGGSPLLVRRINASQYCTVAILVLARVDIFCR